jgi:hypothetical protein
MSKKQDLTIYAKYITYMKNKTKKIFQVIQLVVLIKKEKR